MEHSNSLSIWKSAGLFCLVSLTAFSLWAFQIEFLQGASLLYPAIALVFILGGAPSMLPAYRKNNGSRGQIKYLLIFWPAFIVFAAGWWIFWEMFLNHTGEIFGSFLGLSGMVLIFTCCFRTTRSRASLVATSFAWYTINYYLADFCYNELKSINGTWAIPASRLIWGLFFGIGMGTALAFITDSLRQKTA